MIDCRGGLLMTQIDAGDVKKHFQAAMSQKLDDRLRQYKEQREEVKAVIKDNPILPLQEQIANSGQILVQVLKLTDMWNEVMPYIRKIKSSIADVLDENRIVACYLLFGKFSQGLSAIFILLKNGFHYEAMELIRSNREALDLILLFLREPEDSDLIKKWFTGEIVANAKARDAADKYLKEVAEKSGMTVSIEGLKTEIYRGLSKFSHVSYLALVDSYDVYSQDFDFDRHAGHHYALQSGIGYVRTEIHSVLMALKTFYSFMQDRESYVAVDAILRKYAPDYFDEEGTRREHAALVERLKKKETT
jgi:hypothetical protein